MRNLKRILTPFSTYFPLIIPRDEGLSREGNGDERVVTTSPFIHHPRRSAGTRGRRARGGVVQEGGEKKRKRGEKHHRDLAYIHSSSPAEQREERDARQSEERRMRQQD